MKNSAVGLLICVTLPLLKGEVYRHQDWKAITPVIQSEVQRLDLREMKTLLGGFCVHGIQYVENAGVRCSTGNLGRAFDDVVGGQLYPVAVIYGRFLSSDSEDAVVSGSSAETHPSGWGGTLLLSRTNGGWTPVWYRSAIITHSCWKVATPGGREVPVCEDREGGMGHELHLLYVYAVDLPKPFDDKAATRRCGFD